MCLGNSRLAALFKEPDIPGDTPLVCPPGGAGSGDFHNDASQNTRECLGYAGDE